MNYYFVTSDESVLLKQIKSGLIDQGIEVFGNKIGACI